MSVSSDVESISMEEKSMSLESESRRMESMSTELITAELEQSQQSGILPGIKEFAIETIRLGKSFGKENKIRAVDNLNLQVRKGEIFGFVGPNGAGKTTTMKMLIGLLEPSEGSGKVAGFDIVREVINIRETTGVLPEPVGFYDNLTARQNLRFYAKLYNIAPEV